MKEQILQHQGFNQSIASSSHGHDNDPIKHPTNRLFSRAPHPQSPAACSDRLIQRRSPRSPRHKSARSPSPCSVPLGRQPRPSWHRGPRLPCTAPEGKEEGGREGVVRTLLLLILWEPPSGTRRKGVEKREDGKVGGATEGGRKRWRDKLTDQVLDACTCQERTSAIAVKALLNDVPLDSCSSLFLPAIQPSLPTPFSIYCDAVFFI